MDIQNPRRILAVALPESQAHLSRVIKELSGSYPAPSPATGALAGITHELALVTPYYSARVPVWLDIVSGDTGEEEEADEADDHDVAAAKAQTNVAAPASDANKKPAEASASSVTEDLTKPAGPVTTEAKTAAAEAAAAAVGVGAAASSPPPPPPAADLRRWADAFLADEAREVRAVLGGVVVVVDVTGGGSTSSSTDAPTAAAAAVADPHARQRELVAQVGRLVREGLGERYKVEIGGDDDDDDDDEDYYHDAWDGVALAVGVTASGSAPPSPDQLDSWEDACAAAGLEFVLVAGGQPAMNEFGEKTGLPRVREALEANDWSEGLLGTEGDGEADDDGGFGDFQHARPGARGSKSGFDDDFVDAEDDDDEFDPESLGFGFDRADFAGLRQAILEGSRNLDNDGEEDGQEAGSARRGGGSGSGDDPADLEHMMRKLLAVRDLGAGLPPEQRRRLAARAVGEVMREL